MLAHGALMSSVALAAAVVAPSLAPQANDGAPTANAYFEDRRAAYGPMRVCIGDVALRVTAQETATGRFTRDGTLALVMLYQHPWRGLTLTAGAPDLSPYKVTTGVVRLPSGLTVTRYRLAKWEGLRAGIPGEAVWSSEAAHRVYRIGDGAKAIWVTAEAFESKGGDDRALLDRIEPRGDGPCGTLAPPATRGAVPTAETYEPVKVAGPALICGGGLAIALRTGETLTYAWGVFGAARTWLVQGPEGTFDIRLFLGRDRHLSARPLSQLGFRLDKVEAGYADVVRTFADSYGRPSRARAGSILYSSAPDGAVDALLDRLSIPDRHNDTCFEL
jgi:hypothetical protein